MHWLGLVDDLQPALCRAHGGLPRFPFPISFVLCPPDDFNPQFLPPWIMREKRVKSHMLEDLQTVLIPVNKVSAESRHFLLSLQRIGFGSISFDCEDDRFHVSHKKRMKMLRHQRILGQEDMPRLLLRRRANRGTLVPSPSGRDTRSDSDQDCVLRTAENGLGLDLVLHSIPWPEGYN